MKLLSKSLRSYFIFSSLLLLVTIPLFYFVVQAVLLNSVDKSLRQQLSDIRGNLPNIRNVTELEIWSSMDKDIRLTKADHSFPDSLFTDYLPDPQEHEQDPYRQIRAAILLNGQFYTLTITSSLVENDDLLGSIVAVQAFFLILLLLGMLWINRGISKRLWTPFYNTLSAIRTYELNKHSMVSFEPTSTEEFRELNTGLEGLLNKNYETYLAQKDFTGSAAHEMQTPLAILQSQIELLMQTTPLTAEQAGLIQNLELNNKRIVRTNRSLLLLAKIENEGFSSMEDVDLSALIPGLLDQYKPGIVRREIRLEEEIPERLTIKANRTLLEMLLSNMLSNAVRHNVNGGKITVSVSREQFTVRNTGVAQPLDDTKMYERFYKSGPSQEGIGLGLAIVRRICSVAKYRIGYAFDEGEHQFRIWF